MYNKIEVILVISIFLRFRFRAGRVFETQLLGAEGSGPSASDFPASPDLQGNSSE